jgi:hypothetical protein
MSTEIKYVDSYCGNVFDTFDQAVTSAKGHSVRYKMDVPIYKTYAIARYPFPDIKVDVLEEPVQAAS